MYLWVNLLRQMMCCVTTATMTNSKLYIHLRISAVFVRVSPVDSSIFDKRAGASPERDQWCPAPPFEIGAPPFHVWPTGCFIHPILYLKNVALPTAASWRRACKRVSWIILHFFNKTKGARYRQGP